MAGNPFFSGRIPKELNESIIKHCEETGKSKTEVLIAALSNYLNIPVSIASAKTDGAIEKELATIRERMKRLEEIVSQSTVITYDNNDDKGTLVTVIPQSENFVINKQNKDDNKLDEKLNDEEKTASKINLENSFVTKKNIENIDNKSDNNTKTEILDFKYIETKEVTQKSNISSTQMVRHKNTAFEIAKSQGYNIEPDITFSTSIEIKQKKEILVEDKKYRLFCIGTNSKTKPIWNLVHDDNTSYHPDILASNLDISKR